ncbi:class I SAM-dependent methyltransferase [Bradyrhizobium sp. UFLA05-153]
MNVLGVGCGRAAILPYLPQVNYTGIDLNEKHIAFVRQRYGEARRFIVEPRIFNDQSHIPAAFSHAMSPARRNRT